MTWARKSSECWLSWNRMTQNKQHTVSSSNVKLWQNKNHTTLSCFIISRVKLVPGRYIINYFTIFWSAFWIREKLMNKTIFKWMDHKTKSDETFLASELCVFCFPGWERLRIKMLPTVSLLYWGGMLNNLKPLKAKLRHFKDFKGRFTEQINSESAADAVFVEWISASFTHAATQETWSKRRPGFSPAAISGVNWPPDNKLPQSPSNTTAENLSVQRLILPSVQTPAGCRTDGGKPSIPTSDPRQEAGASSEEQTDAARLISTQMINHSLTSYIMNEWMLFAALRFSTWYNGDQSVIDH